MATFYFAQLDKFPKQLNLIGRLLLAYGELEVSLCHVIAGCYDTNIAIKSLFRPRGETQRIQIADGLARALFAAVKLDTVFSETIADMQYALSIRNLYAHCYWHSEKGSLVYSNFEQAAQANSNAAAFEMNLYHVPLSLLKDQEAFFTYVREALTYLRDEYDQRMGKLVDDASPKPKRVQRPPRDMPLPKPPRRSRKKSTEP
jgi:hypothetical protein